MDETPEQLKRAIEVKHEELSSNLTALNTKAKELADWRAQFEERPLVVLGAAFAGGVVVAALLGGGRSRRSNISEYRPTYQSTSAAEVHASGGTWHRLRGAFGAVAAGAAMELLNKAAPGLKEHLIDPVREHMTKGDDRVGTYSGSSPFAAPSAMRTNGYNAPDTM